MRLIRIVMPLVAPTAMLPGAGYALGGPGGAPIAFRCPAAINLRAFSKDDRILPSMCHAREMDVRHYPFPIGTTNPGTARRIAALERMAAAMLGPAWIAVRGKRSASPPAGALDPHRRRS